MEEMKMPDFDKDDLELEKIVCGKRLEPTKEETMKPLFEEKPSFGKKLIRTAKDGLLYALLSAVLIWWKQTGMLDETAAWYALVVCIGMVFFAVGKNWWCKE